jgi:hypothetical protein
MNDPRLDPAMRSALDRFTVPPLPANFADRIIEAADKTAPAARPLPDTVPRPAARRRWMRTSRIAGGVLALSLVSAAAAATGYLGDRAQTITRALPVVGPILAEAVPARKKAGPEPARTAAAPRATPVAAAPAPPAIAPMTFEERAEMRRGLRREIIAERIATGLERRAERRAALGLPDTPPRPREAWAVLRRIPPAERRAVIERVREIRREQATRGDAVVPSPPGGAVSGAPIPPVPAEAAPAPGASGEPAAGRWRAERLQRFRERRQRLIELRREQFREENAQAAEGISDEPR